MTSGVHCDQCDLPSVQCATHKLVLVFVSCTFVQTVSVCSVHCTLWSWQISAEGVVQYNFAIYMLGHFSCVLGGVSVLVCSVLNVECSVLECVHCPVHKIHAILQCVTVRCAIDGVCAFCSFFFWCLL